MLLRIRHQDQGLLYHVPVINKYQNGRGANGPFAQRQTYPAVNLPLPGAVYLRRLHHRRRDPAHELCQQKHCERRKDAGQPDGPIGIQQVQPVTDQVVGYQRHLIGHQHQDNVRKENDLSDSPPVSGKSIGSQGGHYQLEYHDRSYQYHGIPELEQILRTLEQHRIVLA